MPNANQTTALTPPRSDDAATSTRAARRLTARRVLPRRRRERRGIILVFVVVLLMLLAIMGTAYLATARADRLAISSRGSLPGVVVPRLADRGQLDAIFNASATRVQNALIEDVFNVVPGTLGELQQPASTTDAAAAVRAARDAALLKLLAGFRQEQLSADPSETNLNKAGAANYYENYDATGRADAWLASLLPIDDGGSPAHKWNWIGAPLLGELAPGIRTAPFFSDPTKLSRTPPTTYPPAPFSRTPPATTPDYLLRYNVRSDADAVAGFRDWYAYQRPVLPLSPVTPLMEYDAERADARLTAVPLLRGNAANKFVKNTRLYPGFTTTAGTFMAGDADGDGMADSGLMPVVLHPANDGVDRYIDAANNVVYFVGYRVVDNSAQVNFNTALTAQGDFATMVSGTGNTATRARVALGNANVDAANLGFFRSNVGLTELIHAGLEVYRPGSGGDSLTNPESLEIARLFDVRAPFIGKTNADPTNINLLALGDNPFVGGAAVPVIATFRDGTRVLASTAPPTAAATDSYYKFRSLGDLLEQQLARHPEAVGGMRVGAGDVEDAALKSLSVADAVGPAARGGTLINSLLTPGEGEAALTMTARLSAPNFTTNGEMWKWFPLSLDGSSPASAVGLWYDWSKNFHATPDADPASFAAATDYKIAMLDEVAPAGRSFRFTPAGGSNLAPVGLPRPLRSILTARSGVTNAVPERRDGVSILPPGMPRYGDDPTKLEFPAVRVAAATGTKEALWRAYWSAMTQNQRLGNSVTWTVDKDTRPAAVGGPTLPYTAGTTFDAFLPPDRHPSNPLPALDPATDPQNRLTEKQMALVRSAVAACNTLDLRDPDNDITAMTVDLGHVVEQNLNSERLYARVYGTEKQLVITSVVVDALRDAGAPADLVVVEIFNPTDQEIDLTGYYLAVMDRPSAGSVTLATGEVTAFNATGDPKATTTYMRLLPPTGTVTTLKPGGFLIVSDDPIVIGGGATATAVPQHPAVLVMPEKAPDPNYTPGQVSQVTYVTCPGLSDLIDTKRELALLRTRRADGQVYTDPDSVATAGNRQNYLRPKFSESIATNADLLSLVPLDAVDFRTLTFENKNDSGTIAWYMRNTFDPQDPRDPPANLTRVEAWKCFYAGQFYELRPKGAPPVPPATSTPTPPPAPDVKATNDYPWRTYPVEADPDKINRESAVGTLGAYRLTPATAAQTLTPSTPTPFRAPTIPIQKFTPITTFPAAPANAATGTVDHAPNRFPYGSPFARNGDVLAVPFIGSYKIYRLPNAITVGMSAASYELYDYVPLTMDAVNAAPIPADALINPSVGRFDARDTLLPRNTWAADLFDFVTARQSSAEEMYFPDVPSVGAAAYNDPTDPQTDQDGPVVGFNAIANAQPGVPWVRWQTDGGGATSSVGRRGATVKNGGASQLITGTINLNTAPPVVLRMLPWTVDPEVTSGPTGGGRLDQRPEINSGTPNPMNEQMRRRVAQLTYALNHSGATAKFQSPANKETPFGFNSLTDVARFNDVSAINPTADTQLVNASGSSTPSSYSGGSPFAVASSEQSMMRLGMLNPRARPTLALDFGAANLNMTRVSNLASQRSDCYTVYITVQAWTWVGDLGTQADGSVPDQATDTRLVGERRTSFIVDRSRISPTAFRPSDLLVYPIETE